MKALLPVLLFILAGTTMHAQVVSYEDFKSVIPLVQREDFKAAFDKTSQLLGSTQNDSSDMRAIITYMNIFSAAGMVSLGQMTHDDFLKNANKYIGQRIVMAAHPCVDSASHSTDALMLSTGDDGKLRGMTTTMNNAKTSILCFEYFNYPAPVNYAELVGKNIRSGGILGFVEINPNKSTVWIARLHINNAFARESTPR